MRFKILAAVLMSTFMLFSAILMGQSEINKIPLEREDEKGVKMKKTLSHTNIPFNTIHGDSASLENYEGNVVLIVNVASECGFTPQYADLEKLYREYKEKGLVVIGFPANNFGGQEPGSDEQIYTFCTSKFDVSFPMMSKISVKGDDKHPLFVYLTEETEHEGEIKWNFEKFLLSKDGNLVARFRSQVKPFDDDLVALIEKELKAE